MAKPIFVCEDAFGNYYRIDSDSLEARGLLIPVPEGQETQATQSFPNVRLTPPLVDHVYHHDDGTKVFVRGSFFSEES